MADVTITPNMGLPVPVPSVAPGPAWATSIVGCFSGVDSHNHTAGQGVPITPSAININADLPFNGTNALTVRTVNFSAQAAALSNPTDLGCVYVVGDDLYYNDEQGNQIRITQGGSVAGSTGTITGLPSGTASAAYSTGTFTFQSATSTPATMSVGPVVIGRQASGTKTVTLTPNASQASNYGLTFPSALPASANYVTLDNSGAIAFNASGNTGTGGVVLELSPTIVSPTLTTPTISTPTFSGTPGGTIDGGTYSPSIIDVQGTSGSTPSFSFQRIGTRVVVFGKVTGTSNSSGILRYTISMPFVPTSNFSQTYHVVGGAFVFGSAGIQEWGAFATTGAKTATVQIVSTSVTTQDLTHNLTFAYSCA